MKPRSAIMLAGRQADSVVWYEARRGSRPRRRTPTNRRRSSRRSSRRTPWTSSTPTPGRGSSPTPTTWTRTMAKANTRPRGGPRRSRIRSRLPCRMAVVVSQWASTPFADALSRPASPWRRSTSSRWGRRRAPTIWRSASPSLDSAGHAFGPRSHEVQDVLHRLDSHDRRAARAPGQAGRRRALRRRADRRSRRLADSRAVRASRARRRTCGPQRPDVED